MDAPVAAGWEPWRSLASLGGPAWLAVGLGGNRRQAAFPQCGPRSMGDAGLREEVLLQGRRYGYHRHIEGDLGSREALRY